MSLLEDLVKTAVQAAVTASAGPLAGLAAKELIGEAIEKVEAAIEDKPEESKPA